MIWNKTKYNIAQTIAVAVLMSCSLTACGSGTTGDSGAVTPQGTINLEKLKVGVPEKVLDDAVLTFELDENPISRMGGKKQYMSKTNDSKNGKFLAQCRDGNCFELQAYYMENPVTREQAMETVKGMLPSTAPEQSRVDDEQLKSGKTEKPVENIYFGEDYRAELVYNDKDASAVEMVNVYDLKKMGQEKPSTAKSEEAEKTTN